MVSFAISALNHEYSAAIEELNERVATLRERLNGAGVDPKQLKTTRFGVDADYRTVNKKSVFNGWLAHHGMRLELPVDRDQLNRALEAVAVSGTQAKFSIGFEVRDQAGFREALLADAMRSARRNAEAIVSAAGCRLGKVVSIEYGWSEIRFSSSIDYAREVSGPCAMASPDIEPEDVDAQDSVTVVWQLIEG